MKIIRRHIFETNSSHGHSWHTNGVAYASPAPGAGARTNFPNPNNINFKAQNKIDYTLVLNTDQEENFISIDSNLNDTELMPVYIWKKTADPELPGSKKNSVIEVTCDTNQTYTMSVVSDGMAEPTVNIISSKQISNYGFSLPPYTDPVFENSYMFQWQMSTDNSNWYDIIGANNSTYAVAYNSNNNNTDVTYYFKCLIYGPYNKESWSVTSVVAIKFNEPTTTE